MTKESRLWMGCLIVSMMGYLLGATINGELKGALLEMLASDPANNEARVYYNTTSDTAKLRKASSWVELVDTGSTQTVNGVKNFQASSTKVSNSSGNANLYLTPSSGDEWLTQADSSSIYRWFNQTDANTYGLISGTGAWTWGDSSGTQTHTLNGRLKINPSSLGPSSIGVMDATGTNERLTLGSASDNVMGVVSTLQGLYLIADSDNNTTSTANDSIRFGHNGVDNSGASFEQLGAILGTGAWTLGPSGSTAAHTVNGSLTITSGGLTLPSSDQLTFYAESSGTVTPTGGCAGGTGETATWRVVRVGKMVTFSVRLTSGSAPTASACALGTVLTSTFRPQEDVSVNGVYTFANNSTHGMVVGSSGSVSLYVWDWDVGGTHETWVAGAFPYMPTASWVMP